MSTGGLSKARLVRMNDVTAGHDERGFPDAQVANLLGPESLDGIVSLGSPSDGLGLARVDQSVQPKFRRVAAVWQQ